MSLPWCSGDSTNVERLSGHSSCSESRPSCADRTQSTLSGQGHSPASFIPTVLDKEVDGRLFHDARIDALEPVIEPAQ